MTAAHRGPRGLPSVDRVLKVPVLENLLACHDRPSVVRQVRAVLESHRVRMSETDAAPTPADVACEVANRIRTRWRVAPRPAINATGVILHTNLGRAPLSDAAIRAMASAAGYVDLEYDIETGGRGSRQAHSSRLLGDLTGAEAGLVTTNNAAAIALGLAVVAAGREVLVSRGHAVEIGGGFRIPAVLRQSRARLVDVGTTNRTRLADYADGLTSKTAAILHVHASNFRLAGFTEHPELRDLASLAHRRNIVLVADNGSGSILDTSKFGLHHEPTPAEAIEAGADLVAFSADKLLGGPQAGILIGRESLIAATARHPLTRAVRPDKLTLAALNATLLAYLRGDALETIPIWRMISATPDRIRERAELWQAKATDRGIATRLLPGESTVGGGSLPGETLPTTHIELPTAVREANLRCQEVPIVARVSRRRVLLDLRTVLPSDEGPLLAGVESALGQRSAEG